jgi:hypothetical protein
VAGRTAAATARPPGQPPASPWRSAPAPGGQHGTSSADRGYLAWAVLFGALFAWEGLALAGVSGVPSLSDAVRVIVRYPAGRLALFALWLWAGSSSSADGQDTLARHEITRP